MSQAWSILVALGAALLASFVGTWAWRSRVRRHRRELSSDRYWLGNGGAAPADGDEAPRTRLTRRDRVEASALVPRSVKRNETFRIEAVLAKRAQVARALAQFQAGRDALVAAPPRGLAALLSRSSVLELTLECAQADVVVPRRRRLRWTGVPLSAGFQVRPAADLAGSTLVADLNVFVNRVCVGHLPLSLPLAAEGADRSLTPARAAFVVPRRVFMSYTGTDRAQVVPIALALRRIGVEAFMDRLSIEGGEDWERRLEAEIDACDCFMLFWSDAAARSQWVQHETLRALARQRSSIERRPKIVTHLLGKPPPAPPPAELAELHFNDPAYALWEAAMAEAAT